MRKSYSLLVFALFFTINSFAQTSSQYNFTTTNTASLALDLNGNSVDMTTGTTQLIGANQDNAFSGPFGGAITPGLTFSFMGNAYIRFSVSSNGAIEVNNSLIPFSTLNGNDFANSAIPIIAPYMQHLKTSGTGKVHYKVVGTYPNRTLVIEFLNMSVGNLSTTADATFQARLYEQTNTIEFVYGAMNVGNVSGSQQAAIGFFNNSGANNQFSVDQSSFATSTSGMPIINTNSATGAISGLNSNADGSRRNFIFVPQVPYHAQYISMDYGSASSWCANEMRTVTVKIKNIGTATWTNASPAISIGVKWGSWGDYYLRQNAGGLLPGQTGTYTFTIKAANAGLGSDFSNPNYTSPLNNPGTENLSFDIVNTSCGWFRNNGACSGPGNSVYISPNISIATPVSLTSINTNIAVCASSTTANVIYTTTGPADTYSIIYDAAAISANFSNVVNATLTSPVVLTIPTGLSAGSSYTALLTVKNGSSGCGDTRSITLNVAAPGITFNPSVSQCKRPNVNLPYTVTAGSPDQYSITYDAAAKGAGFVDVPYTNLPAFNISLTVPPGALVATPYNGTLTVRNSANGCISTSNGFTLTLRNTPTITLPNSTTSICSGGTSINLPYSAITGGPTTYNLIYSPGEITSGFANVTGASLPGSAIPLTIPASAPAGQNYYPKLSVQNAEGCTSDSLPLIITVNPLPSINVGVNPSVSVCKGATSANLPFTSPSGNPDKYSITYDATALSAGFINVTISTLPASSIGLVIPGSAAASTYNGILTVTNSTTGCGSGIPIKITINPLPTGTITSDKNPVCASDNVTFTATSGFFSYLFKLNGTTGVGGPGNTFSTSVLTPSATSMAVDVTDAKGCVSTWSLPITVSAPITGTFSVSENSGVPNDNIICSGSTVNFSFDPGYKNYEYILNGTKSLYSGTSPLFHIDTLTQNATITLVVTNSNGCTLTYGPAAITVNPLPSPAGNISGTNTICQGQNGVGYSVPAIANATGYTWNYSGTGATISGSGNSISISFSTVATSGNLTVTGTNACGSGGVSAIYPVTVNNLPVTTGNIAGTGSVCQGQNGIGYSVPVINNATTYTWAFSGTGATISGSGTSINIDFSPTATAGNLTVTGSNACGSVSIIFPITVNLLPVTTGNITGPASVCSGQNAVIYSIPQITNATAYSWSYSGTGVTISGSGQSATINFSSTATSGNLIVTGTNPCGAVSKSYTITVNSTPSVVITQPAAVCSPGTINLTDPAIINGSTGGLNYTYWTDAGATISYSTPTTAGTGNYYLKGTTASGCYDIQPVNITVNPLPVPTLNGPNPICPGAVDVYHTDPLKSNYTWNITGGSGSSTGPDITVTWNNDNNPKSIYVNYADPSTNCYGATPVTVVSNPSTSPTIQGPSLVCINSTGNYYTEQGMTNYSWVASPGGTIINGQNTYSINVTWTGSGPQSVSVNYTSTVGCTATTPTVYPVNVTPLPVPTFSYAGSPYCSNTPDPTPTFSNGGVAGTFSSNLPGLSINANTGKINISASTPGTYTVTNIIAASGGCGSVTATFDVTITALPLATFSYTGTPYCKNGVNPLPAFISGGVPGTFSSTPSGLVFADNHTGEINLSASTPGNYTITNTIAATNGCGIAVATSSFTITALPTVGISYSGSPFCKSLVTGQAVTLTGTGAYSGGLFSSTPGLSITNAGVITPNTSTPGAYTINYATPASGGCAAVPATTAVIITDIPTATITYSGTPFCSSVPSATVTLSGSGAYTGGTYSVSPVGLIINPSTGVISPNSVPAGGTFTITYTVPSSGGCSAIAVTTSVTITPAPTVVAGNNLSTCAAGGAINITAGSSALNYSGVNWTSNGSGTFTNASSLTTATYQPSATDISNGNVILTLTATGTGSCGSTSVTSTKTLIINANPAPVVITPASASLCMGNILPLSSVQSSVTSFTSINNATGMPIVIPDNNALGMFTTININSVPVNAIIDSINVSFRISHPLDRDLRINLKAPNGKVINLANLIPGSNFTNTVISSNSSKPIQTFGISPYTGTFAPNAAPFVPGATSVPGNTANTFAMNGLFSIPNGNWIFSVRDNAAGNTGTLEAASIKIFYHVPTILIPVVWSPSSTLFTDAAGTIPYDGTSAIATVYAKPGATQTYTATSSNDKSCSSASQVTLTVIPTPVVTISADYCSNPGRVTLTANPSAVSYNWNTGETTQTVLVDIAHDYYVSSTNSQGCVGTASISVAEELVVNGDFEQGNTGFTSGYTYATTPVNCSAHTGGLWPEGYYDVRTNAQLTHCNFFGKDHTSGNGNFMIVNGYSGASQPIVWQETVNVHPNTTYYFSAWAISLNSNQPAYAQLQFNVNNQQVGSIANLSAGTNSDANPWKAQDRFYGTWNSGANTTAVISVTDLQTAGGGVGNDFGLDDISFGTLSPFVSYAGNPGGDHQTICAGTPIDPIIYKVGSGATGPVILPALPPGLSSTFNGITFTITGTPTSNGVYNYTIATTGSCANPAAATGSITINPNAGISLTTPGNDNQTVCIGAAVSDIKYAIAGGGTNALITGLPSGVIGTYSNGIVTISGFPAASATGTYLYKVTTTGTCNQVTTSGTITVRASSSAGSLNSPTICINGGGTLILSGNVIGSIDHWESTNDNWTTISTIANTTSNQSFSNITLPTSYRVVVKNDVCPVAYSTGGKIQISNLWEGRYSTDWATPANWSSGNMPDNTCTGVTIPQVSGTNFNPVLTSVATVNNLDIRLNGNLKVDGGTLKIAGSVTNAGTFDASNGSIEFNGNSPQNIGTVTSLPIKDLIISNTDATGITLGGTVDIYRSLSFSTTGKNLNTSGHLTLKSTATETAWVGDMTGHTINGNVTVERYINIGPGKHGKAWEFLATPTKGQSIYNSWMEGGLTPPGYGTQITGTGSGFDRASPSPSMKYYDPTNPSGFTGITNTANPVYDQRGYMIFVRGDRSVDGKNVTTPNPTTLRTRGTLITSPITIPVAANSFASIGNPYASAIDMKKVMADRIPGNIDNFFTAWNSNLGGGYGYGAYETYSYNPVSGNYESTPGGITNNIIQSGQAFFVQNTTAATENMKFTEASKASGSSMIFFRPQGRIGRIAQLRTDLYIVNADGSKTLADGTLQQFSDDYTNAIDGMDAKKFFNSSENLSILSGGKNLIVERRHTLNGEDTVFYSLTSVKVEKYYFEFTASNLSSNGLQGFVEDSYLQTRTPLNLEGKTELNFEVTNVAASYAANRFRIVFKTAVALPVTFVSVSAYPKNTDVGVEWKVENESNMKQYEVEKSIDGGSFTKAGTIAANNRGSGIYNWLDQHATTGYNYYRIRSLDLNGKSSYTQIVKVLMGSILSEIMIYPNPITNGIVNLKFINQPAGKYSIRLLNPLGQVIVSKQIERAEGSNFESIKWDYNLAHGVYQLEVTKPDGMVKVIKVMY